jgi:uncharacterized delta-60 repeat protein
MRTSFPRLGLAVVCLTVTIGGASSPGSASATGLGIATASVASRPGDLDPSFGTGGKVITEIGGSSDVAYAVVRQGDGKIVTAGLGGALDFALARYNSDGSLDAGFGTGGTVTTDFAGSFDGARDLVVQADGKLVAAGLAVGAGESGFDFGLARYMPNGGLDPSLGAAGKLTIDFANGQDEANAVAVQADGKLVVAGFTRDVSGIPHAVLTRHNLEDGALDPSFGVDGKVITDVSGIDWANDLALQADGKLVLAGIDILPFGGWDFAVARFNTDGSLDTGFGVGGTVTTDFGGSPNDQDEAKALIVLSNGKLVAGGVASSASGATDFGLARYDSDGTLDTSFGPGGTVRTDFAGSTFDSANDLVVLGNKLVAAGESGIGGAADFALVRYNLNGALDRSFGTGGKVTTDFSFDADAAFALAAQPDGKLVAAGLAFVDFALARYQGR